MADGDADQSTGATATAATDAGESGDSDADAGQNNSGGSGESDIDPQAIYNRGAKEAREAMEGKLEEQRETIESLRSELEELKGDEDGRKSPEDRSDVYTEEQVEELKENYRSELKQREQAVEQANRAHARNVLIEELREQGVVKPAMFADLLVSQGRVQADVTEGFDAIEVLTPEGTKMMTESGDEATVSDLARQWAENNPELVRSNTREGAGYGGDEKPGAAPMRKAKSEMTQAEKREYISEHGHEAYAELPLNP